MTQTNPITRAEEKTEALERLPVFTPPVDIFENKDELLLVADLPGVPKDGLSVHFEKRELSIEGRMADAPEEGTVQSREYRTGVFSRSFRIPQGIDESRIRAELKNGVLTVHLPKAEAAKPREIAIQIG